MNKRRKFILISVIMLLVLSTFLCAACSTQKKPTPQQGSSQQDENKPPKELDKLKESIEKIQKQLESIHEENKKPIIVDISGQQGVNAPQQGGQGSSGSGQDQQKGMSGMEKGQTQGQGQGQAQGQSQGQQQNQEQNLTPQQKQKKLEEEGKIKRVQENIKKFEALKKDVTELHTLWNSYEPKAATSYAQPQTLSGFESALNKLTQVISKDDDFTSLLSSLELSKYLADFYNLYKTDVPAELDKFRYAVKRINLLSEKEDFENADITYKYLEEVWSISKPKFSKETTPIMNKFEFALKDIKGAITAKDKMIVNAKSEMFIKVVDEMEKSIKEAKAKEEQK